ncbi:cation diffusion facilitator family transporter [Methylobacter tundripaludum]|uniref:Cation diffusion facilitator family transporter n=2 Tax=Methylococcaceae TaxID=403 RepID=A0A2S6H780_9GAMM|nr:cation diffusion facilitator family transporter [Methylobacter tundripaludum]
MIVVRMHTHKLSLLKHEHDFSAINKKGERRTKQVLVLTFLTMIVEIAAGTVFGSMALLADGWHMGTHVAAFIITLIAYRYSRVHAHDHTFAFSPGKVGVLGGYTSSVVLGIVALIMLVESGQRIVNPHIIHFDEAIAVAGFGLFINLVCALLLRDHHHHDHSHDHAHHHDQNLKAAYLHVLADALTSVLAIAALTLGKYYGWRFLDPVMGIIGALIIMQWAYSLVRETSPVLLDESIALKHKLAIMEKIENDADNRISDLHIWRVGPGHFAIIISLVSHDPKAPEYYKDLLKEIVGINKLSHITVEVNKCAGDFCIQQE